MIETERKIIEEDRPVAKVCDRCSLKITEDDWMEWAEFMHWSKIGGYGSIWGDDTEIRLDLCQRCQKELFEDFIQIDLREESDGEESVVVS